MSRTWWILDQRLLGKSVAKASSLTLHALDGTVITSNDIKLHRWAEHFASVANCISHVSEATIEALPTIPASIGNSCTDDELCALITEEEFSAAVSQRMGKHQAWMALPARYSSLVGRSPSVCSHLSSMLSGRTSQCPVTGPSS